MKHEHTWKLSFTGKISGTSYSYFRCFTCGEIEERKEETVVEPKQKYPMGYGI